jgi:L-asparaginase
VALVGAMRNTSMLSYDGPANLRSALRTVIDPASRGQGVLVVMNQTVHAAAWATKSDTQALDTFVSPVFGPLGVVETDGVYYQRRLANRLVLGAKRMVERVDLVLMYAGADGRFVDHAVATGARGLVIEGSGTGNVPPAAVDAVQRALDAGVTVVMTSRCGQGRVIDNYAFAGSGHDLRMRGVIFAGWLSGAKARILLMLALGKAKDVRRVFESGSYR